MGYPLPQKFRETDTFGRSLAYGTVETYEAGTNVPLATYSDAGLTVANDNPVELDANGRASIFVPPGVPYKIVVKASTGALIYTEDFLEVPDVPEAAAPGGGDAFPPGFIGGFGGTVAPAGWVLCNGAAYGRVDPLYAALFAVIGTSYGPGNGSTTFNVPNLVGRFMLAKAASGTGSTLGESGGSLDHTHSQTAHTHTMPDHTHTVPAHTHSVPRDGYGSAEAIPPVAGRLQSGGSGVGSESSTSQATQDGTTGPSTAGTTGAGGAGNTGSSGGGNTGAANPPYLVVGSVIIKL